MATKNDSNAEELLDQAMDRCNAVDAQLTGIRALLEQLEADGVPQIRAARVLACSAIAMVPEAHVAAGMAVRAASTPRLVRLFDR